MVSCGTLWVGLYPHGVSSPLRCWLTTKGGEVVVLATVFQAVLTVREDVDEIVAAVIAPGCRPLAGAAGVVVGVFAAATIAAFEIARRVDNEKGRANAVPHGLCRPAHHFADGRHAGLREFDVGQAN